MFKPSLLRSLCVKTSIALTALCFAGSSTVYAQRAAVATHSVGSMAALADAGVVPASQPMQLTLRIAMSDEQNAALDQLLTAQSQKSSASYHQWQTPAQFATSFGATDDQIASLTSWAQSQGLTVAAVSPAKTRMTISGTAGQVQSAFAVSLHHYVIHGADYYANTTEPSAPVAVATLIAGVSGLNDLPLPAAMTVQPVATAKAAQAVAALKNPTAAAASDPFTSVASAIDANTAPLLAISTAACSTDFSQADYSAYSDLFRQANAQGITVLATSSCSTGSFPASLAQVTSVTVDPIAESFAAISPRPAWQAAPGLPSDGNRDEPDLTTSSLSDFSQAMTTVVQNAGSREGNINGRLYALATTPDLYQQADGAAAGTWEASSGLGTVNLAELIKAFPDVTGTLVTTTSLQSSSYALSYGAPITLSAKVLAPVYGNANPTGTVMFTGASQGNLGSASVDSSGNAVLILSTGLNVGAYNVTASYSGDSNYAASSNTTPVIITVSIVTATISAVISPVANVPYGSTATVTATVTLPGSAAAPSGTVSAQIQGITGAVYSATLTPNVGSNTATANININAPPPQSGAYTVSVTCAGNANFQCQAPATPTFTSAKGNTSTTISLTPAAPQAGQPVTITATINNNGNGTGAYTFSGNVTFTDTTTNKTLATVPVGTNQAATSQTLAGNIQHNIVATYTGDAYWNGSVSTPQAVTPTLLPATMTLSSNVSTALAGVNVVLTATVFTTVSNTVGPTGTVNYFDTFNGSLVQLGVATLTPNGPNQSIAVFNTTGLLAGTHSIYAVYNGDSNFTPFTSSTLPITLSDYTLVMVPQTLTLSAGQKGQVVVLLGLVGGFNGTVTFGCTPPASTETTCSFSPVTLTGGGTTTMTITTTAPVVTSSVKKSGQQARSGGWRLAAGSTSALAMMLCWMLPRRRRTIPVLFLALLTLSLPAGLGCGLGILTNGNGSGSGSGSGGTTTDPGTPLGTTSFTITTAGTDGVNIVRHNYQYQVTVQ
jgi:trimeric autotransporter adhesin